QPSPIVMKASSQLLRLSSVVTYRRLPHMCASELIVNVQCHSTAVLRKNPMNRPDQPKTSHVEKPSTMGGTSQCLSSHTSSGNLARSLTRAKFVLSLWS